MDVMLWQINVFWETKSKVKIRQQLRQPAVFRAICGCYTIARVIGVVHHSRPDGVGPKKFSSAANSFDWTGVKKSYQQHAWQLLISATPRSPVKMNGIVWLTTLNRPRRASYITAWRLWYGAPQFHFFVLRVKQKWWVFIKHVYTVRSIYKCSYYDLQPETEGLHY